MGIVSNQPFLNLMTATNPSFFLIVNFVLKEEKNKEGKKERRKRERKNGRKEGRGEGREWGGGVCLFLLPERKREVREH